MISIIFSYHGTVEIDQKWKQKILEIRLEVLENRGFKLL